MELVSADDLKLEDILSDEDGLASFLLHLNKEFSVSSCVFIVEGV